MNECSSLHTPVDFLNKGTLCLILGFMWKCLHEDALPALQTCEQRAHMLQFIVLNGFMVQSCSFPLLSHGQIALNTLMLISGTRSSKVRLNRM